MVICTLWCSGLAAVTILNSAASVGASAFVGCDNLTLMLPENSYAVQYAEENALRYTTITDLPAPAAAESQYFISGAYGCILIDGQITILNYIGNEVEFVIPDQIEGHPVTAIGDRAFSSRSELRTVTIPSSVVSIGEDAFAGCDNLFLYIEGSDAAQYAWENALRHTWTAGARAHAEVETNAQSTTTPDPPAVAEKPKFEEAQISTKSGGNLILRSTPDSRSKKNAIASMPNKATVTIVSRADSWAKILYTDRRGNQYEGYAYLKYLKPMKGR